MTRMPLDGPALADRSPVLKKHITAGKLSQRGERATSADVHGAGDVGRGDSALLCPPRRHREVRNSFPPKL